MSATQRPIQLEPTTVSVDLPVMSLRDASAKRAGIQVGPLSRTVAVVVRSALPLTVLLACVGGCTAVNPLVASDARTDRPTLDSAIDSAQDSATDNGPLIDVLVRDRFMPDASDGSDVPARDAMDVLDATDARDAYSVNDVSSVSDATDASAAADARDATDSASAADTAAPLPQCRAPNGNQCAMGVVEAPPACPRECTGGCQGSTCIIDCSGRSACQGTTLTCPPRMACRVECTGLSACQVTTINCDDDSPCSVNCGFTSTCQIMRMHCPARASCDLSCTGISSCQSGSVACGAGHCNLNCDAPGASIGHVDCGNSCSCGSTCGCDP